MDTAYKNNTGTGQASLPGPVQLCACQETKEMMQALEPAPTVEDERYDLAQTNAINALPTKTRQPPALAACTRCAALLPTPARGILSMGGALEIAATLRNFACPSGTAE